MLKNRFLSFSPISIVQNLVPFNYGIDAIYQCFSLGDVVIVFDLQLKGI